ncbi:adenosine kinase [Kibdelosporangium banguiense]|uniref:Adenosine kinase n=1 Tax=Kibdelosporangium banguiense TaxID=1365924 RepID=A0ABS4TNM5_9PSEU|nr:carbohydrate kinase family protein [Kibdelosporangium banguiense]MBP2326013.1 adenosine kinase [Kibdelosporangium banguiense]
MRVLITGSIATDHLMVFPGRFADQFLADRLDAVSLSFLVDTLDIRRGGVAANICVGLARLGVDSALVGSVGHDFAEYRAFLDSEGVDTRFVHVSADRHTARFVCTTDQVQAQIASFYPGAMSEAGEIALRPIADRVEGAGLVLISPNDPGAMLRHTEECRDNGYPFAADPSQQLAWLPGDKIQALVRGAALLFTNEYEADLLLSKTGWTRDDVLSQVGRWVTTLGEKGVRIDSADGVSVQVAAATVLDPVDPTGVGDGFRSGFIAGLQWGLGYERAAQTGCALASFVLEVAGPQEYRLDPAVLLERIRDTYGPDAAADVAPHLPRGGWR